MMTAPITNIFVLMLENHSFDNVFAMSGIPGIRVATTKDFNVYDPKSGLPPTTYHVRDGAPPAMTTDPGHEFPDVLIQLCGAEAASNYKGGAYPKIDLSGFATSYATSISEDTGTPQPDRVGDIMACFDTPKQLPVIHQLATDFAICDAWHSSLPGPTWPNRLFVHGASSSGLDRSPTTDEEIVWESYAGFVYGNGSIYDRLNKTGHKWRLYQDKDNQFSDDPSGPEYGGWISQVAAIKGISLLDIHSLKRFARDLHDPAYRDTRYTFIEPNFGRSFFSPQGRAPGPPYKGGSAQHPEDDPSGGEGLIKFVYETIRNSPVWETSLLIVTYDEHGGFYDHVAPGKAPAPGDPIPPRKHPLNSTGFDFTQFGVRVPTVIVSPYIAKGTVDPTLYDHTSVLATLERVLGIDPLTERDKQANDVRHLLNLAAPRTDCPTELVKPLVYPQPLLPPKSKDASLPQSGNPGGFLQVALKAELALFGTTDSARDAIVNQFLSISTIDQARAYVADLKVKIDAQQAAATMP